MATTAQQIITAAIARSFANRPDLMDPAGMELVGVLGRVFRGVFAMLAPRNPEFFGTLKVVPFVAGPVAATSGWSRPSDALSIYKIEPSTDTKNGAGAAISPDDYEDGIAIVPFNDRVADGDPSVYEFGQLFVSCGRDTDPASGGLAIYYAKAPVIPSQGGDTLDPLWPEQFNDVLITALASYLAKKDNRQSDADAFSSENQMWMSLMNDFLRDATIATRQRFGQFRALPRTAARAEDA